VADQTIQIDADELVRRARDLSDEIKADAIAAEKRGTYSPELHERFRAAGFYSIFQPKLYGGLELGLVAQYRTMMEVARADTGIAWCLTLGTHHTLPLVAHFPEPTTAWAFRNGYVVCPHSINRIGVATPVEGGFRVSILSGYNSGSPYSTHAMLNMRIDSGPREGEIIVVLFERDDYTVLDDWGGDRTMALGASGSNSIEAVDVFIPEERTVTWNWFASAFTDGTPGSRSTGNPLYLGNIGAVYHGDLAAVLLGAALGARDAFEQLLRTKQRHNEPKSLRFEHRDGRRQFAQVYRLLDSARTILLATGAEYEELNAAAVAGKPVTTADHLFLANRMYAVIEMAWQATELMFRASSSAVARTGHPIQRALLAIQMQRPQSYDNQELLELELANTYFGTPAAHA
jgi:3-hydroxy-9,10-secoandrosta-1,3,5(10)-triene-9,17-dione monooxygenase